ncbi:ATP-binding protein [Nocardioides gilvus]|uniref:ATP-binding protein n=1 Tax=Nocardioides gilvus TaxID=1735589 RepID=UPI000D74B650|nr:ATP-binding protein [Nocardioides gilvus]
MTPRPLHPGGTLWAALVLCAVVATGFSALRLSPDGLPVMAWWPVAGLSVALLARMPLRLWLVLVPIIGVSHYTALLMSDRPVTFSLAYGSASLVAALAGALVLRGRRDPSDVVLRRQMDVVRLMGSAAAAATVMVLGGVIYATSQGDTPPPSLILLGISHLASVLVIVPVLTTGPGTLRRFHPAAFVVQSLLLAGAIGVVFAPSQHLALVFLPLPLLTWAAYRFGLRIVSWQILFCAVGINVYAAFGHGPFAWSQGTATDPVVVGSLTQGYLVAMTLLCLPVALSMHQSDRLARELRASRDLSDMTLATTGCMIMVSDMAGTVLRANPAVSLILGHRTDDVVGRPIWETIVSPEHRAQAAAMFTTMDGSLIPTSVDGRVRDLEGCEHRVLWTSGVVCDDTGTPTHVVMTGLDMTAERNAAGLMEHVLGAALDTAIIGTDTNGRITLFNAGAQAMLGQSTYDAVGRPFTDILDPAGFSAWAAAHDAPADFSSLVQHQVDAPPTDWEWRTSLNRDGAPTRRVSTTLSGIHDHGDTLIGYLCVGSDVTELHQTAELLVTALEKERQIVGRLKDLDTAKDQFVSTVSHELRTPVSTIIGYGEMLVEGDLGDLSAGQVKALEAITRNGERLVTLVDNLLALSGLASNTLSWDRDPVDLRDVLAKARDATSGLVENRSLTVTFEPPADEVSVIGDLPTLTLALTNLLSNAVKFTEDGGQVRCVLDVSEGQGRFLVHDDGLGIAADEQVHLFTRFWRSTTAQRREIQGTGLGLSTVQSIILAHGGTITIDSAHLAGTTVTVLLPLTESSRRKRETNSGVERA